MVKNEKVAVFFLLGLGVALIILLSAILVRIIVLLIKLSLLQTIHRWLLLAVKLSALVLVWNFAQGGIKT